MPRRRFAMDSRKFSPISTVITPLCLGIAVLLIAASLAPAVALAHAKVATSSPAEGETAATGLTSIKIAFTEEISPDQSNAQLSHAGGAMMADAKAAVDRADRKVMIITTPALTEGKYTIKWHAVTEDD